MTANPFAALLDGVRRYSYHDYDEDDGFCLREKDVLSALAAAVPADLAEAGKVLEGVTPGKWRQHLVDETTVVSPDGSEVCCTFPSGGTDDDADYEADWETHEANARFIAWCREGVPALLARIAAQEAQIKGLEAERDEPHWDDHCVNQFAKMMREKMAAARAKGRIGWNDPNQCSVDYLRHLLYEHLDKGDPVDVANFCMMLRHYDASTRRDYGNTLDMWKARAEAAETALAAMTKERDELATANHRQASCIHVTAANLGPDCSATVDGLPKAARHVAAERDALLGAVKGLVEVLDQHETKGPLPDVALMFCWLAAQNVRAALRGNTLEKPE